MRAYLYALATDGKAGFGSGGVRCILYLLSLLYGRAVSTVMALQRRRACRLPCKVISVGNITVGGTGKTPLVEYIARYLSGQGHSPAILTRGYRKVGRAKLKTQKSKVKTKSDSYGSVGDEAYMLQQKLKDIPVIVDTDRRRGARRAVEEFGVDTVILDDGFQQWGIAKDLEIVAIDATNPFGNRHMLPRGILRQPLSTLRDAGIFVLTKTNLSAETAETLRFLSQCNPAALIVETAHQPAGFFRLDARDTPLSVDALAGKRALLVSGIADPLSFEQLMHNLNIEVAGHLVFADHHRYTSDDWVRVSTQCSQRGAGVVVTTEKDAVRLEKIARASSGTQVMVLRIELVLVKDAHGFNSRLRRIYNV